MKLTMSKIITLLSILFFLIPTTVVGQSNNVSTLREYVSPVLIMGQRDGGDKVLNITGSTVVISTTLALTAYHIVEEPSTVEIIIERHNKKIPATVIRVDKEKDLALLEGQFECPCVPISRQPMELDDEVVAVGYPLYSRYRLQLLSRGYVQDLDVYGHVATTTTTAPGGSGGGLFAYQRGRYYLVGIVAAIGTAPIHSQLFEMYQEYNWLTFSVSLSEIEEFLQMR